MGYRHTSPVFFLTHFCDYSYMSGGHEKRRGSQPSVIKMGHLEDDNATSAIK